MIGWGQAGRIVGARVTGKGGCEVVCVRSKVTVKDQQSTVSSE